MRLLLAMPVISKKIRERICQEVIKAFGGELYEVIIGGAAFNQEVEARPTLPTYPVRYSPRVRT